MAQPTITELIAIEDEATQYSILKQYGVKKQELRVDYYSVLIVFEYTEGNNFGVFVVTTRLGEAHMVLVDTRKTLVD